MANLIDNDAYELTPDRAGYSGYPNIVRDSNGRIYVAHVNISGYLEIHYSDNEGRNWTLDTTFTDDTDIRCPCLCIDSNDNLYISFTYVVTYWTSFTAKVKKRTYATGSWSEIRSKTGQPSLDFFMKSFIAINRCSTYPDRLHFFWVYSSGASDSIIANEYSDNGGSSWSATNTKLVNNCRIIGFALDTLAVNGFILFYTASNVTPGGDTYYPRTYSYTHAGAYWDVREIATDMEGLCGILDEDDYDWLIFITTTDVYVYKSTLPGQAYAQSLNFSEVIKPGSVCISTDESKNIYIFYTKNTDSNLYMRKYSNSESSWKSEVALSSVSDGLNPSCEKRVLPGSEIVSHVYYNAP